MKPTTDFPFLLDNPGRGAPIWEAGCWTPCTVTPTARTGISPKSGYFPPSPPATPDGSNSRRGHEPPARHRRHPEIGAGKRYGGLSRQGRGAAHPRRADQAHRQRRASDSAGASRQADSPAAVPEPVRQDRVLAHPQRPPRERRRTLHLLRLPAGHDPRGGKHCSTHRIFPGCWPGCRNTRYIRATPS